MLSLFPGEAWQRASSADILLDGRQLRPCVRQRHQLVSGGHSGLHLWDSTHKDWRQSCGKRLPDICHWFPVRYVQRYKMITLNVIVLLAFFFFLLAGSQVIVNYTAHIRSHKIDLLDLPAFLTFSNASQVFYLFIYFFFKSLSWNGIKATVFSPCYRMMSACLDHWQRI